MGRDKKSNNSRGAKRIKAGLSLLLFTICTIDMERRLQDSFNLPYKLGGMVPVQRRPGLLHADDSALIARKIYRLWLILVETNEAI